MGYCWGIAEVLAQLLNHIKKHLDYSNYMFRLPQLHQCDQGMLPSRVFLEVH